MSSIANFSTAVRGKALPRVGNAGVASAPIPASAANLGDIVLNDTSDPGDF
jgi:hypothetical protein